MSGYADVEKAVRSVRRRSDLQPRVALILGSGLGGMADAVDEAVVISTADVAGYPAPTVAGHEGRLVLGRLDEMPMICLQGRAHLYEGYSMEAVSLPVRLVHALGCRRLLVTNAAGGIHPMLVPGTLMFIADHINFVGSRPAYRIVGEHSAPRDGPRREGGPGPVRSPYDPDWLDQAEEAAVELGIRTSRGVYLWTRGPSYETKAEIVAFRRLGADAVGMSTVPEVLQAAALGMHVLGISTITNRAAGLAKGRLSHDEVVKVGAQVRADLEKLVRRLLSNLREKRFR